MWKVLFRYMGQFQTLGVYFVENMQENIENLHVKHAKGFDVPSNMFVEKVVNSFES